MLARAGVPLRYWAPRNGAREIELVAERGAAPVPIEVKASRGSTASLNSALGLDGVRAGCKPGGG